MTRIFIHPLFQSSSLINSVAILRVTPNVPLGQLPTISTGCLPASSVTPGLRCWVAGWGAQNFVSGAQQAIQTHVDVPIVDQATCQTKLRTTRLGPGFALDTNSFMCAGGEAGKGLQTLHQIFGLDFEYLNNLLRCLHWRWRRTSDVSRCWSLVRSRSRRLGNR